MNRIEKIVNGVYITSGIVLLMVVIMAMSSCGSTKMYNIGTGEKLNKSRCSGNYIYK